MELRISSDSTASSGVDEDGATETEVVLRSRGFREGRCREVGGGLVMPKRRLDANIFARYCDAKISPFSRFFFPSQKI